jgi:hypothetical protein
MAVSPWTRRRKRATPPRKASHNGPPLARLSSFPRCAAGGRSHPRARFRVAEQLRDGLRHARLVAHRSPLLFAPGRVAVFGSALQ